MRVLLALDESEYAAKTALTYVQNMEAELTVLFIVDATWNKYLGHDWLLGSNARGDFMDWIQGEEKQAAINALEAFKQLADGIPYKELVIAGDAPKVIKETAQEFDLLIIANPFTRGLERMRNTNKKLLEASPCSLLFVQDPSSR